ncbi:MAG: flagellar assembly protein FliW [Lachnospiraceae bacterium]|nr:flagellar assembly protein FliW [Lachnospiraceae bacterium]
MLVKTRYFGEVELEEEKILTFDRGIIGFERLRRFTLIYNSEKGSDTSITWLQSIEEPSMALPVINPSTVLNDYTPNVADELLDPIGELTGDNTCIFVTLTVPSDITKMTTNLKAPIIINADTKKGCQVIAENDYPVKYNIYDVITKIKAEKGDM